MLDKSSPTLWIACGVLALVGACLCAVLVVAGAGGIYFFAQRETPPVSSSNVTEQMDTIAQWVIEQRGLQPTAEVERKFLTTAEVRQRMLEDLNEDMTAQDWEDDTRVLAAYGLVDPNLDLYNLLLRLYSEGVAGFYDPDTHELVIVSEQGALNAYERVTFAHEYNHALQDQIFGVREMGFSEAGWETDPQRAAAVQALLEGDSSLLEEQFKDTLTRAENREYDEVLNGFDLSIYSEIPEFLLRDFAFPYVQGLEFVKRYYRQGGWARVDEVWQNPPTSQEQILHPELYDAGEAPLLVAQPALTDTLGAGWREIDSSVTGEWYTYLILAYGEDHNARLSDSEAARAAAGWGGDGYVAYYNDTNDALVLAQHWVWDTAADADEFNAAFSEYANARFGPAQVADQHTCWADGQHCLYVNGPHSLWLIAPTAALHEAVLSQYPDFP